MFVFLLTRAERSADAPTPDLASDGTDEPDGA